MTTEALNEAQAAVAAESDMMEAELSHGLDTPEATNVDRLAYLWTQVALLRAIRREEASK